MKVTPIEKYSFSCRDKMRYETLGDYTTRKDGGIDIKTFSKMTDIERKAVAIHELIEQTLLEFKGITPEMVDRWDTEDTGGAYDPNMYDKNEWYKKADYIALSIEKIIIEWAGMKWGAYDRKLDNIKINW